MVTVSTQCGAAVLGRGAAHSEKRLEEVVDCSEGKHRVWPLLHSLQIGIGSRIDLDLVPDRYEEWHRDYGAALQGCGLAASRRGVALEVRIGLDNLQLHECRYLGAEYLAIVLDDVDLHPIF